MRIFVVWLAILMPFPVFAQTISNDMIGAVSAATDENYTQALDLAGGDDVAADLVRWIKLREGDGNFDEYRSFVATRADWPDLDRIRAHGEVAMPDDLSPVRVFDWFAGYTPQTGQGAVRLADALMAQGETEKARDVVVTAWLTLTLSETGQTALIERYGDALAPHHAARVDALLWRWRTQAALRMEPLLDADQVALLHARTAYIRKASDIPQKVAAVPAELADTPGLAYDRYSWLASRGERTDAIEILKDRSTSAARLGEPFRWSGWRRTLARWEMREGRITSAYELATQHFLTEGSSYADLEWLAGYLALTYLDDPQRALSHFGNFASAVDSPISRGRAGYWIGRTRDRLGDDAGAAQAFKYAARYQTSFYGLLAAQRLGQDYDPALSGAQDVTNWQGAEVMETDLVRAAAALLAAKERGYATRFFAQLGRTLDAADIGRLGAWLQDRDEAYFAVLIGKAAALRDIVVPSVYFPLHPMTEMELPTPMPLALSVARRESEFNAVVGSPVGALGLMQLMPATAQEVSNALELPYSKARLTSDWQYNAVLGAQYLAGLEEQFGYSPVQIAAGYNAGPSRPLRWMDERGDPRLGETDVVDWIEHIPFRETRNYAMRVTEAIPVYEARLNGLSGPVQFLELLIGNKPSVRPRARGTRQPVATPPTETSKPNTPPPTLAPSVSRPRILPRPSGIAGVRPIRRSGE